MGENEARVLEENSLKGIEFPGAKREEKWHTMKSYFAEKLFSFFLMRYAAPIDVGKAYIK